MRIILSNVPGRRFFAIVGGIALLFWFPIEDRTENIAILFAILISTWFAAIVLHRTNNIVPFPINRFILAGILAGVIVTPLTLLLMVFKTGLHAHPIPDYNYQQFIAVIGRTPIWLIGGFFIGLGLGFWFKSQLNNWESSNAAES